MFQADLNSKDGELNDVQRIKIANTLSEFVTLNKTQTPIIFDQNGNIMEQNKIPNIDSSTKITRYFRIFNFI